MANVDFGAYKRIVQYFYDPEPRNYDGSTSAIWCLGVRYPLGREICRQNSIQVPTKQLQASPEESYAIPHPPIISTPPESVAGSYDSDFSHAEPSTINGDGGSWPSEFLDDFEARIWLTYRSNFPAIPKSQDPKAASAVTFSVRLRNIGDRGGFTSDTGFGCMIRSGQSLLANSILCLRLGRGILISKLSGYHLLIVL